MATKKTSKKDKLKEEFAQACLEMSQYDTKPSSDGAKSPFDEACMDATRALILLNGPKKGVEKDLLLLILKLGAAAAEFAYGKGYLKGHIDSMVDTGYLERSSDGLLHATQKLKDTKPVSAE